MPESLFHKYQVAKTDGSPTDPEAVYFVLRLDTDPHARVALDAYADSVLTEDGAFACALWDLLRQVPLRFR